MPSLSTQFRCKHCLKVIHLVKRDLMHLYKCIYQWEDGSGRPVCLQDDPDGVAVYCLGVEAPVTILPDMSKMFLPHCPQMQNWQEMLDELIDVNSS